MSAADDEIFAPRRGDPVYRIPDGAQIERLAAQLHERGMFANTSKQAASYVLAIGHTPAQVLDTVDYWRDVQAIPWPIIYWRLCKGDLKS
jgi:hypothetical protein